MTEEYGNYENRIGQPVVQGNQPNQTKTDAKGKLGTRDLEQLGASADPMLSKLSEKTHEILSASPSTTALLEEHDFDSNISDNDLFEKTNSIGQPILSELNQHSKMDEKQPDIQMQIRQKKVEESLKSDDFAAKIDSMTLDELEEALGDPALTDKEQELIFEKLDQLAAELTEVAQNELPLPEINKFYKELDDSDIKIIQEKDEHTQTEQIQHANAIQEKNRGEAFGKNAISIASFCNFTSLHLDPNSKAPKASFDLQTGIFSGPKDIVKLYQVGQIISHTDENNVVTEHEIREINEFTKEEEEAFQEYISANYPKTNSQVSVHEEVHEEKDDEHKPTASKETKHNDPINRDGVNETQQNAKLNGFKTESASAGMIHGKSSQELFLQRLQKLEEKFKRLEEKIEQENKKHDDLVQETQTNNLNLETKKADFRSDELTSENLEIENQYKDLLKMVNDPKRGFEIPLAVSTKIKSIDVSFQKIEKIIPRVDTGNINTNDMLEISSLKKEVIGIVAEMLNTNGTNVTKGTQTQGKTAPAAER